MPTRLTTSMACAFVCLGAAHAQFGRGTPEWGTAGGDAHRSSSVPADPKISVASLSKPGFALFWKMKLNNEARQLNALMPPTLMDRHIGIHGFRSFGFVTGSGDNVYAVDTDLARIDWQKNFGGKAPADASLTCPGGMTTGAGHALGAAFATAMPAGRGRGSAAKSGVGEPGEGGVTLAEIAARAAAAGPNPGRGGGFGAGGGRPQRMPVVVHSLSSDGMLHANFVSNGDEPNPAIRFLPPNANAQGLIIVDNVAYVATVGGCGGVPNGVWALDLASKAVTSWKATSGDVAGSAGPAFGGDGTLYVSTTGGDLVALEPKTLKVKDVYRAGQELTSSPVVFQYKDKAMVAATTKDGRLHLVDGAAMGKSGVKSAPYSTAGDFVPGAISTWQDASGTRWILAPTAGAGGGGREILRVEWRCDERRGGRVEGCGAEWGGGARAGVGVARSGESVASAGDQRRGVRGVQRGSTRQGYKMTAAQRVKASVPAVVYALDASNGKELWNSGKTITSFARGGVSGGAGQIYVGTHDGTLYSFGFPIEH